MPATRAVTHRGARTLRSRARHEYGKLAELVLAAMSVLYLGVLWLVACIPLVTVPAATVALIARTRAWSRGGESPSARTFVAEARVSFVPRTLTLLMVVAVYAVLAIDVHAIGLMGTGRRLLLLGWFVTAIVAALLTVFVLPALAVRTSGPGAVLKRSATVAVLRPHLASAAVGVVVMAAVVVTIVPLVLPVAGVATAFCVGRLWERAGADGDLRDQQSSRSSVA